jgi:hypothetical protein
MPKPLQQYLQDKGFCLPELPMACNQCCRTLEGEPSVSSPPGLHCCFPLCKENEPHNVRLELLALRPDKTVEMPLCQQHLGLMHNLQIKQLAERLFVSEMTSHNLCNSLIHSMQRESVAFCHIVQQQSINQILFMSQLHQAKVIQESHQQLQQIIEAHQSEVDHLLKGTDMQQVTLCSSSMPDTLESAFHTFVAKVDRSLREQRDWIKESVQKAQQVDAIAQGKEQELEDLKLEYHRVLQEYQATLADNARLDLDLRAKKEEVRRVKISLDVERGKERTAAALALEMMAACSEKAKRRRKKAKQKRAAKKKLRLATKSNSETQVDQSGFEEVSSPEEAYLWLLEHNYSLNDLARWNRFSNYHLPFSKYAILKVQREYRAKCKVKERLNTVSLSQSSSFTYVKFIDAIKGAILERYTDLPPSGKIQVCLRGDGRAHHGDNTIVILFSLPDLPDPQSNVIN